MPHLSPAVILALLLYYVLNAAAGAMLPPEPGQERTRYGYWWRFTQGLAANSHRLAESKLAGIANTIVANEVVLNNEPKEQA